MPLIGSATGSFFAGRRASAFTRDWSPSMLGNDLRMWLNPSDTSTTTFQAGPNNLTSITDASGNSGATININNTPHQSTEDNKEIIVFDQASNEFLSTGSFQIADSGNHWAAFAGTISLPTNSKDSYGVLIPQNHLTETMPSVQVTKTNLMVNWILMG